MTAKEQQLAEPPGGYNFSISICYISSLLPRLAGTNITVTPAAYRKQANIDAHLNSLLVSLQIDI